MPLQPTPEPATEHVKPHVQHRLTARALHFSVSELQSRTDLRDPDALDLEYTRLVMGFLLLVPAPTQLAMIGLGVGHWPSSATSTWPAATFVWSRSTRM